MDNEKDLKDEKESKNIEKTVENPEILDKVNQMTGIIRTLQSQTQHQEYSGPLPPTETWKTLDKEQQNLLLQNLITSSKNQHEFQMEMMKVNFVDEDKKRKSFLHFFIIVCITLVLLVGIFIFTNNSTALNTLLTLLVGGVGGGGAGAYYVTKKNNDE